MTTDNVLTIFRLGIEATEQERIARGTPPDTEWIRARCGLPIKILKEQSTAMENIITTKVVNDFIKKSIPQNILTTTPNTFIETMERVPAVLVPKERRSKAQDVFQNGNEYQTIPLKIETSKRYPHKRPTGKGSRENIQSYPGQRCGGE